MLFKHTMFFGLFFSPDGAGGGGGAGASGGDSGEGGSGDSGDGQGEGEGEGEGQGGDSGESKPDPKPDSANKLIKDFVAKRGISVEDLLKQITDQENAQKTELEKITGERDTIQSRYSELESRHRETIGESAFVDAATKAKARSPRLLFHAYKSQLEYDDAGQVTNLKAVLDKAKSDEPGQFLKAAGRGDGGAGSGTGHTHPDIKPGVARMAHAYEENERAAKL